MPKKAIPVEKLPPPTRGQSTVWEFAPESESRDETWVRRVTVIPVKSLGGRRITTFVKFANGIDMPAMLGNLDLTNPQINQHFLSLSVFTGNGWFHLARYHDVDAAQRGPVALAKALNIPVSQIFPIRFDISDAAEGNEKCLTGEILMEPSLKLGRDVLIQLALERAQRRD